MSSQETAVLPKDKMQCLLVGVGIIFLCSHNFPSHSFKHCSHVSNPFPFPFQAFNQLKIATHVEMVASLLRIDSCRIIKTVLAGTATSHFTDVIESAFGGEETADVREAYEEAWEEEDDNEEGTEGTEASTTEGTKRKQLSAPSKRKLPRTEGSSLEDATVHYPTLSDEGNHLHAAVDPQYISSLQSSSHMAAAGYGCLFSVVTKSQGKIVPDCDKISTTKGQMSTHIRKDRLNVAIGCYICGRKWWSAVTWMEHMRKTHSNVGANAYFIKEGAEVPEFEVKEEVTILHV